MIEVLIAKMNKVANRIVKISRAVRTDMYGDGSQGNVFYGTPGSEAPLMYETVYDNANFYRIPLNAPAHYKNLYIDEGTTLSTWGDYGTILVQDTLTLKGTISSANTHSGNYAASTNTPTVAYQLKMLGETTQLYTTNFFITGGTGNPAFGGGSVQGGGCLVVYYTGLEDKEGRDLGKNFGNCIQVNGGSGNATTSGGCLIIAARHIVLQDSSRLSVIGGDGQNADRAGLALTYKMEGYSL